MGDRRDPRNIFRWDRVVINFPGTEAYDFCQPWVYKEIGDRNIYAYLFAYVDGGHNIGIMEDVCWEASSRRGSKCSWLGIKYNSRKLQLP